MLCVLWRAECCVVRLLPYLPQVVNIEEDIVVVGVVKKKVRTKKRNKSQI